MDNQKKLTGVSLRFDEPQQPIKELEEKKGVEKEGGIQEKDVGIEGIKVSQESDEQSEKDKKKQQLDEESTPDKTEQKTTSKIIPHGLLICMAVLFAPFGGPFSFILVPAQASSLLLTPYYKKLKNKKFITTKGEKIALDRLVSDIGNSKDSLVSDSAGVPEDVLVANALRAKGIDPKETVYVPLTPTEYLQGLLTNGTPKEQELAGKMGEIIADPKVEEGIKVIFKGCGLLDNGVMINLDPEDTKTVEKLNQALSDIVGLPVFKEEKNKEVREFLIKSVEERREAMIIARQEQQPLSQVGDAYTSQRPSTIPQVVHQGHGNGRS